MPLFEVVYTFSSNNAYYNEVKILKFSEIYFETLLYFEMLLNVLIQLLIYHDSSSTNSSLNWNNFDTDRLVEVGDGTWNILQNLCKKICFKILDIFQTAIHSQEFGAPGWPLVRYWTPA